MSILLQFHSIEDSRSKIRAKERRKKMRRKISYHQVLDSGHLSLDHSGVGHLQEGNIKKYILRID
jgi:hypothetical protein